MTTTALKLHPENETRLLSIPSTDTPAQTKAVMVAMAQDRAEVDLTAWRELQEWLAAGPHEVAVPFGPALAEAIPPVAVRLRRDFRMVLTLIEAHALLHQATRERDHRGRVVATLADYAAVRELVADLLADVLDSSVPATVRETVEAIRVLAGDGETTMSRVATKLALDKSAAGRRVRAAIQRGYVKNLEHRRGQAARLVVGDPLPRDQDVLPQGDTWVQGSEALRPARLSSPPVSDTQQVANPKEGSFLEF